MSAVELPIRVEMTVAESVQQFSVDVAENAEVHSLAVDTQIVTSTYPEYQGETTVTPNAETQTLLTAGTVLASDVIVNPIPQNYGLITYNGSVITVS